MKELRIVYLKMGKEEYDKIIEKSQDINADLCFWDYPFDELDYLMQRLLDEDECDYDVRYFAIIDKRLYELPDDWKELIE